MTATQPWSGETMHPGPTARAAPVSGAGGGATAGTLAAVAGIGGHIPSI